MRKSILFVCLGNICRSPLAEGIFADLAESRGVADRYRIDSAGTAAYHVGEPPDPRTVKVAARHGVALASRARQTTLGDLRSFDLVVTMDASVQRAMERMAARARAGRRGGAKVVPMRKYDPELAATDGPTTDDVPDPYYGGTDGFERVHKMLERCCQGLLNELEGG